MATSSHEGEAGWDANQEECVKLMNQLINCNNTFAKPHRDFVTFRAAMDGIVQSEFENWKSETLPCALSQFVSDVYRRVWHTVRPFSIPSNYPHNSFRPADALAAPFFIAEDLAQTAKAAGHAVGIDALNLYVKSNLAPKYYAKLEALKTPAAVEAPIPPSRECLLRQQAAFKAAIKEEEQKVSDTPGVKNELPREEAKLGNDSAKQQTTAAAAEVKPKQTSTARAQVPPKRPFADGAEAPAPKRPKMLPPTPVQGSSIQSAARGVATLVTLGMKPLIPQSVDSSKSSSILEALLDAFPEGLARLTSFTNLIATTSGPCWKYRWFCVTCIGTGVSFRDIKDASSPELYPCVEHRGCDWVSGHGLYIRFVGTHGQSGWATRFEYDVLV